MRPGRALVPGLAAALCLCADTARPFSPPAGDFAERPVYFERFPEITGAVGDELDLLRRGLLRVQHYEPVDVSEYAWERGGLAGYTWWMQTQELRFLVPAIASAQPGDRRLAVAWFMRWYAVHMVPAPATRAWGEPMTVAYRAMVLVHLLKAESARADRDDDVLAMLRETLLEHQRFLLAPENFDDRTNHGFIEALGLIETTRVFADPDAAAVARTRLETLSGRAISPAGIEREHSAGYHFTVLLWLEQMGEYFASLPSMPPEFVARIRADAARMRLAGHFLQDHAGRIPPIGDTDSVSVDDYSPGFRTAAPPAGADALFDAASGFCVYKGARGDCRYVVFRIPGGVLEMRDHCHPDALALFFSHAGETIIGDTGRYSYSSDSIRDFCTSPQAHSTLVPYPPGAGWYGNRGVRLVRQADDLTREGETAWRASFAIDAGHYVRTVRVPAGDGTVSVEDSIVAVRASGPPADLVQLWHLGSDVTRVEDGEPGLPGERAWILTTRRGQRVRIGVTALGPGNSGVVDARVVRGQEDPRLGWYSPSQGKLHPVSTLVVRLLGAPRVIATTRIEVVEGECPPGVPRRADR